MFHRCFHRTKKTLRPCPFNGLLDQVEALPGGKTLFIFTLGGIIISHCLKVKCFLHGIPAIVFPTQAPIFPQSPQIYRKTLWRFQDSGNLYFLHGFFQRFPSAAPGYGAPDRACFTANASTFSLNAIVSFLSVLLYGIILAAVFLYLVYRMFLKYEFSSRGFYSDRRI